MQRAAQQALEFHRIVEAVCSYAATPLGRERLASLRPQSDPRRVAQSLGATTEGARYLADGGLFPLQAPPDIGATLAALAVEGRPLEPLRLLGLADFLDSLEQTRGAVKRAYDKIGAIKSARDTATDDAKDRFFGRGKYARA